MTDLIHLPQPAGAAVLLPAEATVFPLYVLEEKPVKDQVTVTPSVYRGLMHLLRTDLPIADIQTAYRWCCKHGHQTTADWILLNPEVFAVGLISGFIPGPTGYEQSLLTDMNQPSASGNVSAGLSKS